MDTKEQIQAASQTITDALTEVPDMAQALGVIAAQLESLGKSMIETADVLDDLVARVEALEVIHGGQHGPVATTPEEEDPPAEPEPEPEPVDPVTPVDPPVDPEPPADPVIDPPADPVTDPVTPGDPVTPDPVRPPAVHPPIDLSTSYRSYRLFPPRDVTWTEFNRAGGMQWTNAGGDWIDANGVKQGDAPVSSAPVVLRAGQQWVELDVLPFIEAWRESSEGLFVRSDDPTLRDKGLYRTIEFADATLHPHVIATLADGSEIRCACLGDCWLSDTTQFSTGDSDKMSLGPGMLRFDVSEIPESAVVTSAVMRLFVVKVYGGDHTIGTYWIDVPLPFDADPNAVVTGGFADGMDAADLRGDPRVKHVLLWEDNWRETYTLPKPPKETAQWAPLESRDGVLIAKMPTDPTGTGQGEGTSISLHLPVSTIPEDGIIRPATDGPFGPKEMYFGYWVKLRDDWTGVNDRQLTGGKMPGPEGRWGYPRRYDDMWYWNSTGANGGEPGFGQYLLPNTTTKNRGAYQGFSFRGMWYAKALGQYDNPMYRVTPIGWYAYYPEWEKLGSGQDIPWRRTFLEPGRWYWIESYVKINDVIEPYDENGNGQGVRNGVVRAWVNGFLVHDIPEVILTKHNAIAIQSFWLLQKNGGTVSPILDHTAEFGPVVVATERIGLIKAPGAA